MQRTEFESANAGATRPSTLLLDPAWRSQFETLYAGLLRSSPLCAAGACGASARKQRWYKKALNLNRCKQVICMFAEYIQACLRHAKYEILEDGMYMSTVEGLQGVIAIGDSIEECRQDLIEVIEGWIALRLRMGDSIPSIDGVTIDVSSEPIAVV
jgi:predicted RNase H-like HicB family nuclease